MPGRRTLVLYFAASWIGVCWAIMGVAAEKKFRYSRGQLGPSLSRPDLQLFALFCDSDLLRWWYYARNLFQFHHCSRLSDGCQLAQLLWQVSFSFDSVAIVADAKMLSCFYLHHKLLRCSWTSWVIYSTVVWWLHSYCYQNFFYLPQAMQRLLHPLFNCLYSCEVYVLSFLSWDCLSIEHFLHSVPNIGMCLAQGSPASASCFGLSVTWRTWPLTSHYCCLFGEKLALSVCGSGRHQMSVSYFAWCPRNGFHSELHC